MRSRCSQDTVADLGTRSAEKLIEHTLHGSTHTEHSNVFGLPE